MATNRSVEQGVVITRIIDAPREDVFSAWTEPEQVKEWWGPTGFTTPFCEIDLRVGGVFHSCMRSPEGRDYCGKGIFQEIKPPERLVFTDTFVDKQGNQVPATYYDMSESFPDELLIRVTFEELDGKTKLTLEHIGLPPGEDRDMAEEGWSESLDRLEDYLIGESEE